MFTCCTSKGARLFVPALALMALALVPPDAAQAATCYVPSALYPTIQSAVNNCPSGEVITLAGMTFTENVTIKRSMEIDGSSGTVVDGGGSDSVFIIGDSQIVGLSDMTITHGNTGIGLDGGGIRNNGGILTLNGVTVSGNMSAGRGGGISNIFGDVVLYNSTVNGNSAKSLGGGIFQYGTLTLNSSTVSGNAANGSGGGIYNNNFRPLSVSDSTIAFNRADAALSGSGTGGGIYNLSGSASVPTGTVYIKNTILDSNLASDYDPERQVWFGSPNDCAGLLTSQGWNLFSLVSSNCTIGGVPWNNIINQSARLGPLANNGGPTQTHALLRGSPAIDAIFNGWSTCGSGGNGRDQRGWSRPFPPGGACDIGAYELGAFLSLPLIAR